MTSPRPAALLLIDVINDFYVKQGSNYYPSAPATLPAISRLLTRARDQDALVVHAVEQHRPGIRDHEFNKLPVHGLAGSEDVSFVDGLEPDPGRTREVIIPKRRFSAFFATDLDLLLREEGITTVIVAGVKTNVCIRATIQDAFASGYHPVLPRQATNSNRPHLEEASIEDINRYFGEVVDIADAEARL